MSAIRSASAAARLALIASAVFLHSPIPGFAQQSPVLGYVAAKGANPKRLEVLVKGLNELGYIDGKTITLHRREAVLDSEYHAVLADLVGAKVDMILAANIAASVA